MQILWATGGVMRERDFGQGAKTAPGRPDSGRLEEAHGSFGAVSSRHDWPSAHPGHHDLFHVLGKSTELAREEVTIDPMIIGKR